jgi:hypothetical protein
MMWNLTILLKGREQAVMLNFRGGDAARKARAAFMEPTAILLAVPDDFGSTFHGRPEDVHALLIQDLDGTFEAQAEQALIQARAQAKVQRKAQSDPLLAPARLVPANGVRQ